MNSTKMIRPHRCLYLMLLLMFVAACMIVRVSYSQSVDKATSKITCYYKMTGRLQVFSLEGKEARVDDLTWDLADTFRTKDIPPEWKKKDTVEFTKRKVWIYYYVSLVTETSPAEKRIDKKTPKLITKPDEIQKIHDKEGKIYKIELLAM